MSGLQLHIIILLLIAVVALTAVARKLLIPYPILLVIGGLVLGMIPGLPEVRLDPKYLEVVARRTQARGELGVAVDDHRDLRERCAGEEIGHLDGRANQFESPSFYSAYPIQSRAIVEWVVRQAGGEVTVTAESAKAGTTSLGIALEAEA